MAITWDEARIAALSDKELLQLRDNAVRKANAAVAALCEEDITRRGVTVKIRTARAPGSADPLRQMQSELAADIGGFATDLSRRYDLTPETAKQKSGNMPRFIPHKLTQANGTAKLGGLQRSGMCRIDRYVSYRVNDTVLSLNMFLGKGAPDNAVEFQVFGPQELFPDAASIEELRPGLATEKESKLFRWGQRFARLPEAKALFEQLVSKVADRRVA